MTETENTSLQRYVLFMVLLNALATPMMLSAVNVALPHIGKHMQMTAVQVSWIPMSYLMASAMFVLIFGRLADLYGRKKVFLIGTFSVIASSLLAAVATNDVFLLLARFLQGVSAAMLYATQVAIITSVFPKQKRGQMIGYTVALIYLGLSAGPLIGGYLIDQFGWRISFVLHIPLALGVIAIALLKVPDEWLSDQQSPLDVRGAMLYAGSIALLCAGVSMLPDVAGVVCLVLFIVSIILFFRFEKDRPAPVFDVSQFFVNRVFTFSCLASLIMYTATFGNIVLVSLYLQSVQQLSATTAGVIMMIQPLSMALLSPLTGRLSDRIEPRWIATAGVLLTVMGLFVLSTLDRETAMSTIIVALLVTGAGFSLFSSPNVNAIMSSVEKRFFGSATAAMATMRIVGQLTSMVLVALMFNLILADNRISPATIPLLSEAISNTFLVACILCLSAVYFSLARGKMHTH